MGLGLGTSASVSGQPETIPPAAKGPHDVRSSAVPAAKRRTFRILSDLPPSHGRTDFTGTRIAVNDAPSVRDSTTESMRGQLERVADQYDASGMVDKAKQVREWILPPLGDRQRLYLRPLVLLQSDGAAEKKPGNSPGVLNALPEADAQFDRWRHRYAQKLYAQAQELAANGQVVAAYQMLYDVLRNDPLHEAALRIVGRETHAVKVAVGKGRNEKLNWRAGTYWRAHSKHFRVTTNHSVQTARTMAYRLEKLHQVWRQLFVLHWTSKPSVRRAFTGKSLAWPTRRRHDVVVFSNRQEFIRQLKPVEPQIEMALGVYRDKVQTTYFYEGKSDLNSTWLHEATHQLFHETVHARAGTGKNFDFWMLEAAAMYLESTQFYDEYATVGGSDAVRLQIARQRAIDDRFYVPLHVISELGQSAMQRHADVRRLYTQSAGYAHFLMDGHQNDYRAGFVQAVSDLYRRPSVNDPLWKRLGISSSQFDLEYQEFLASLPSE